ncbi:Putative Mg2+ and Co2+ transporter CorB [Actinobacillus equuli]|nr:Putative Mg2+ and Co2+ transporter CorB [Actinobacillus equuli]
MSLFEASLIILLLIIASAIISSSEISLAGARKLKLQAMINEGDLRAEKVLKLQEQPGRFITVVQIGLNMVAILGGVVGESAINPYFSELLSKYTQAEWVDGAASWIAFIIVTSAFVLFADLMPKRIAMTYPEKVAVRTIGIMMFCIALFKPLVLFFDWIANTLFKLFHVSTVRQDNMTSEDIVAVVDAGAKAGI